MYWKKLHKFDFDLSKLYDEWQTVHNSFLDKYETKGYLSGYQRLYITHSDLGSDQDIIKSKSRQLLESFSLNNVISAFKNTYTENACREVNSWFNTLNLRVARAKFACLLPGQRIGTHVDIGLKTRYHIPIIADNGVIMVINEQKYEFDELGYMYSMTGCFPHSAENNSDRLRLLLSFDVVKL